MASESTRQRRATGARILRFFPAFFLCCIRKGDVEDTVSVDSVPQTAAPDPKPSKGSNFKRKAAKLFRKKPTSLEDNPPLVTDKKNTVDSVGKVSEEMRTDSLSETVTEKQELTAVSASQDQTTSHEPTAANGNILQFIAVVFCPCSALCRKVLFDLKIIC